MSKYDLGEYERVQHSVNRLNLIDANDPERAHGEADEILLAHVPLAIEEAYRELVERCKWWAAA